jgi:hypothetical protein
LRCPPSAGLDFPFNELLSNEPTRLLQVLPVFADQVLRERINLVCAERSSDELMVGQPVIDVSLKELQD